MARAARTLWLLALGSCMLIVACAVGCVRPWIPPGGPSIPPIVVEVRPDAPWTETSIEVKRGERLEFTATGTILWQSTGLTAGPDGKNGAPGWSVGAGGLIGMIAGTRKVFDIGARTQPFRGKNLRSRITHPPPPLVMPADGRLELGLKNFRMGDNRGAFEVNIRRVS